LNTLKDTKYANMMKPYINYWEAILEMLANLFPQQSPMLLEGFWPTNKWTVNHLQFAEPSSTILMDKEDIMLQPFYGPKNMKPTMKMAPYTPFINLHNGDFVLARPSDLEFTLYGWAERIVMLSRMRATSIIKWCMCNGGCC
jgi:hypothetical protein